VRILRRNRKKSFDVDDLVPVATPERLEAEKEEHRKWLFGEKPYRDKFNSWPRSLWGDIRKIFHELNKINSRLDVLEGVKIPVRTQPEQIRFYVREWLDEHKDD
jgi:hypothetical protein